MSTQSVGDARALNLLVRQYALSLAADLVTEFPPLFPVNGSDGPDYLTGWDLCVIGGDRLPGIAEAPAASLRLKRDPNSKAGSNGGRPVYHGLEEQEVRIKVIVWTQSQMNILWALRSKLIPIPGVPPKNVSIDSPWIKLIGITSVAIIGATGFTPHRSDRVASGREMTLSAVHWLGGAKTKGKNVTVQPQRAVNTTRPYTPPPGPTSTAGACGPPASGG